MGTAVSIMRCTDRLAYSFGRTHDSMSVPGGAGLNVSRPVCSSSGMTFKVLSSTFAKSSLDLSK